MYPEVPKNQAELDTLRHNVFAHHEQVASLIVAAVEGTVAMCRAKRSIEPLDHVSAQLEAVVVSAMGPPHR